MSARDVFTVATLVVIVLAILAVTFGINMLLAGGDIACAFAKDPALCAAVKGTTP